MAKGHMSRTEPNRWPDEAICEAEERGGRSALLRAGRVFASERYPDSIPRDDVLAVLLNLLITPPGYAKWSPAKGGPADAELLIATCAAPSPEGLRGRPAGTWVCTDVVEHDGGNHRHFDGRGMSARWPQTSGSASSSTGSAR